MTFQRHCYTLAITGELLFVTRNGALVSLDFADFAERCATLVQKRFRENMLSFSLTPLPVDIKNALDKWSTGDKLSFANLRFDEGGTQFQRSVWAKLRIIPCGTTWSYAQLAIALDNPKAVRAVARANALNPIGIITPCHRVIGSDGSLTGYAGGLERKRVLLEHEGVRLSLI